MNISNNFRKNKRMFQREGMVDLLRRGKIELLALVKAKMKDNGKILWCRVSGIRERIQGTGSYEFLAE